MPFTFFQNQDFVTLFGKAKSGNRSAKSGADDDEVVIEFAGRRKSPYPPPSKGELFL
jgi:hypothetical protein